MWRERDARLASRRGSLRRSVCRRLTGRGRFVGGLNLPVQFAELGVQHTVDEQVQVLGFGLQLTPQANSIFPAAILKGGFEAGHQARVLGLLATFFDLLQFTLGRLGQALCRQFLLRGRDELLAGLGQLGVGILQLLGGLAGLFLGV